MANEFDKMRQGIDSIPEPGMGSLPYVIATSPARLVMQMFKDTARSVVNLAEMGTMTPEQQMQRVESGEVVGDTLNVLTGGSPAAAARSGTSLGIFGGRIRNEADVAARSQARIMEANDALPEDILRQTGLQRDVKGNWVFETDDSVSKLNLDALQDVDDGWELAWDLRDKTTQFAKMGDLLDHPELYAAYPELKDLPVSLERVTNSNYNGYNGTYEHAGVFMGMGRKGAPRISLKLSGSYSDLSDPANVAALRQVLIHEAQHAVQGADYEKGIPALVGGSESYAKRKVETQLQRIDQMLNNPNFPLTDSERKQLLSTVTQLKAAAYAGDYVAYRRLAGEAQATNAEIRLGMSAESRRNTLATETQMVPNEQQLDFGKGNLVDTLWADADEGILSNPRQYNVPPPTETPRPYLPMDPTTEADMIVSEAQRKLYEKPLPQSRGELPDDAYDHLK